MDARTRLGWVRLHEQVGNAGIVCRRCGISQPWCMDQGRGRSNPNPARGQAMRT